MKSGLFTLFGINWGPYNMGYPILLSARRKKMGREKKKVCIECMEILNEILNFYDTFPSDKGDKSFFEDINEDVRKSLVKLKVLFANEDTRIIKRPR